MRSSTRAVSIMLSYELGGHPVERGLTAEIRPYILLFNNPGYNALRRKLLPIFTSFTYEHHN